MEIGITMSEKIDPAVLRKYLHTLKAASGYAMLGMFEDALTEIDQMDELQKGLPDTVETLHHVYSLQKNWKDAAACARKLIEFHPEQPQWWISWAYSIRRAENIQNAYEILSLALEKFPGQALIHYNLACYECQMGKEQEAIALLQQAFAIKPQYLKMAEEDPDLANIKDRLPTA